MFAYVYSWLYPEPIEMNSKDLNVINSNRIELITEKELLSVNLKPYNVIPSPARNMPNIDKFTLQVLSKAQLKDVLAVKLKKTETNPKKAYYEPRHPVLRELLMTRFKY